MLKRQKQLTAAVGIAAFLLAPLSAGAFGLGGIIGSIGGTGSTNGHISGKAVPAGDVRAVPRIDNSGSDGGGRYDPTSSECVTGTVYDTSGREMPRCRVVLMEGKGSSCFVKDGVVHSTGFYVAVTNDDGYFSIPVKPGYSYTVVAWDGSLIGIAHTGAQKEPLSVKMKDQGMQVMFSK